MLKKLQRENDSITSRFVEKQELTQFRIPFVTDKKYVLPYIGKVQLYAKRNRDNVSEYCIYRTVATTVHGKYLSQLETAVEEAIDAQCTADPSYATLNATEQETFRIKTRKEVCIMRFFYRWLLVTFKPHWNHLDAEDAIRSIVMRKNEDPAVIVQHLKNYWTQLNDMTDLVNSAKYMGLTLPSISDDAKCRTLQRIFIHQNNNEHFHNNSRNNKKLAEKVAMKMRDHPMSLAILPSADLIKIILEQRDNVVCPAINNNGDDWQWYDDPKSYDNIFTRLNGRTPTPTKPTKPPHKPTNRNRDKRKNPYDARQPPSNKKHKPNWCSNGAQCPHLPDCRDKHTNEELDARAKLVPCSYGEDCRFLLQGNCKYIHTPKEWYRAKRMRNNKQMQDDGAPPNGNERGRGRGTHRNGRRGTYRGRGGPRGGGRGSPRGGGRGTYRGGGRGTYRGGGRGTYRGGLRGGANGNGDQQQTPPTAPHYDPNKSVNNDSGLADIQRIKDRYSKQQSSDQQQEMMTLLDAAEKTARSMQETTTTGDQGGGRWRPQ